MAEDFPGDLATGTLADPEEWREWFFARHAGLPCPVLNLESGECRLYAHRPVACRLAGPLIQIGSSQTDPCHLCFRGASEDDIQTIKVVTHHADLFESSDELGTLIAFIL